MPLTAIDSAMTSSSGSASSRSSSSCPEVTCSASERRNPTFACESPAAARSSSGSSARISSGVGGPVVEAGDQPPVDRTCREHRQLLADDRAQQRPVVVAAVGPSLAVAWQRTRHRRSAVRERNRPRSGAPAPCARSRRSGGEAAASALALAFPDAALFATRSARRQRRLEVDRLAVERVQCALERHRDAREARACPGRCSAKPPSFAGAERDRGRSRRRRCRTRPRTPGRRARTSRSCGCRRPDIPARRRCDPA